MKKTKIVCTMGPNTDNREIMKELALNGMDVARFNFSHGDHAEHRHRLEILESVREELGIPIASLLDTKGPEIRTGKLKDGKKVTLKEGDLYTLTTEEIVGDETRGYINYAGLAEDVKPGDRILIDDGLIELHVRKVNGTDIVCRIENGGELGEKKGVNVPGVRQRSYCHAATGSGKRRLPACPSSNTGCPFSDRLPASSKEKKILLFQKEK